MRAASSGRPSLSAARIAVDEKSPRASERSGAAVTPNPCAGAELPERLDVARAPLAEAKVGADNHVPHPEPADQHVTGEGLRVERRELRAERQLVEHLDPELLEPPRPRVGGHQPKRRCARCEEGAGVRLEGDDAERRRELGRRRVGERQHRLVAEMHAVEIAHGDRRAAI